MTSQQVLPGKEERGRREADQEVGELHGWQGEVEDIDCEGGGEASRFLKFVHRKGFRYKQKPFAT